MQGEEAVRGRGGLAASLFGVGVPLAPLAGSAVPRGPAVLLQGHAPGACPQSTETICMEGRGKPRPSRSRQGVEARAVSTPVFPSEDELLAAVSARRFYSRVRSYSRLNPGLDLQGAERLFVQHQLLAEIQFHGLSSV